MPRRSKRLSSSSSRFTTAFAHINPVDGLNNGGDPQEPQQQPLQLDRAGEQPQPQDSPQHPLHPQTPHHPTSSPQHQHRTTQQQQPQHQPQQPETRTPEDPQQQHQPAAQQAQPHNNDEETMEILLLPEHPEDNTNAMATSPLPPDDASTSDAENSISTEDFTNWWNHQAATPQDRPNDPHAGNGNNITISAVRDGVVGQKTLESYQTEIVKFIHWCITMKPHWIDTFATGIVRRILTRAPHERVREHKARAKLQMRSLLRNSRSTKVLNLEVVTPEGFMEYVMSRWHLSNGGYL